MERDEVVAAPRRPIELGLLKPKSLDRREDEELCDWEAPRRSVTLRRRDESLDLSFFGSILRTIAGMDSTESSGKCRQSA